MNKKALIGTCILGLVIMGLLLRPTTSDYVQAAGERVQNVLVTNWPNIFNSREQNIDENGNIRVHEQGLVNIGNLPAVQSTIVTNTTPIPVSTSPQKTNTIRVFDNTEILDRGPRVSSDYFDIDGYSKVVLYARESNGVPFFISGVFSIDGVNEYSDSGLLPAFSVNANARSVARTYTINGPKLKLHADPGGTPSDGSPSTTITVDAYLIP